MRIFVVCKALVQAVIPTGAALGKLQGSCSYAGNEAKGTDNDLQHHSCCSELERLQRDR